MDIPAKDVFGKVLSDAVKNILFFGVGALAIAFIGNTLHLRILALVLAVLFALIVFLGAIQFLFSFFVGLFSIALSFYERMKGDRDAFAGQSYLTAGTVVLFIENTICLFYVFYLYRTFFK